MRKSNKINYYYFRPKGSEEFGGALPTIAPPPAPVTTAFTDTSPRFNPFDQQNDVAVIDAVESQIPSGNLFHLIALSATYQLSSKTSLIF